MLKYSILLILVIIFFGCSPSENSSIIALTNKEILAKSQFHHDPQSKWQNTSLHIRIQEPRISNPVRYSILDLNNADGSFTLIRNRDEYLAKYVIDSLGKASVFLDNRTEIDTALVQKYRLDPQRNVGYRNFYQMLYGLPMSLTETGIEKMGTMEIADYNNVACYKIPIELKEALFSKYWHIFIAQDDFAYQGMEIYFPNEPTKGERLYFSGKIDIAGMSIPRVRHWHELADDAYSGSDIIMQELE